MLLDEYQDTSVAQAQLLSGLFSGGHAVTAVGDPNQAIYGWRGASVSNILNFPRQFPTAAGEPATVFPLVVNRRSDRVLAGEEGPRSTAHLYYVALEAVKVAVLVALGIALITA